MYTAPKNKAGEPYQGGRLSLQALCRYAYNNGITSRQLIGVLEQTGRYCDKRVIYDYMGKLRRGQMDPEPTDELAQEVQRRLAS